MSIRLWKLTSASVLLLALAASEVGAQCTRFDDVVSAVLKETASGKVGEDHSTQVNSPSSVSSSASLTDRPSFPAFLGSAIDSGLLKTSDNATTLDLNLFTFLGIARPSVLSDPTEYQRHESLRRFGGAVVFGGSGERFDKSGDEQTDAPPAGTRPTDIVHYEIRFRLTQSRDPRESYNVDRIFNNIGGLQREISNALQRLAAQTKFQQLAAISGGCVDERTVRSNFNVLLHDPKIQPIVADLVNGIEAFSPLQEQATKELEKQKLVTLVVGGVRQNERLGPNSMKLALRGEVHNTTFNLEWRRSETLASGARPSVFKGSFQQSWDVLKNRRFAPLGINASVSASWEEYRDVPAAKHDSVAKLNAKLEYHIAKGINLPISVTWANHKDLVTGEKEIRGHIGFTVDWSKALEVGEASGST